MKYFVAAFAALVASAAAQEEPTIGQLVTMIPSCALPCFLSAVPKICGPQGVFDYDCQCSHQVELRPLITPCVQANCTTQADQLTTAQVALQICNTNAKDNAEKSMSPSAAASATKASSASKSSASASKTCGGFLQPKCTCGGFLQQPCSSSMMPSTSSAMASTSMMTTTMSQAAAAMESLPTVVPTTGPTSYVPMGKAAMATAAPLAGAAALGVWALAI